MSRHHQLMQELERDRAFFSTRFHEPVFPLPGDQQNDPTDHRAPSELTLLLVQRLFLKRTLVPHYRIGSQDPHWDGYRWRLSGRGELSFSDAGEDIRRHQLLRPRRAGSITSFAKPVWKQVFPLLSSGPIAADATNLLISEHMTVRSADLRKALDFVIVDASPLVHYPEQLHWESFPTG
jgi:hypothetical protein